MPLSQLERQPQAVLDLLGPQLQEYLVILQLLCILILKVRVQILTFVDLAKQSMRSTVR